MIEYTCIRRGGRGVVVVVVVVVVFSFFKRTARVLIRARARVHLIQWPDTWDDSRRQRHWDSTSTWTESEKCRKNAAKSPHTSPHSFKLKTAHLQTICQTVRRTPVVGEHLRDFCKHFKALLSTRTRKIMFSSRVSREMYVQPPCGRRTP